MLRRIKNSKWALLGALAVTLLSLYPQFVMWTTRGRDWNGAYAQVHGDEWIYSAYVQALIDGRPRRNDSYTGRDDKPGQVQPESIFSIQFVPAYAIAIPARILGLSSSTAFLILGILTPFLSCLAIFWLLNLLIRDDRIAAAGAVVVLCCGALAGGQGVVHLIQTASHYIYLPFLRRFAPAASFALFFLFLAFVWKSLTEEGRRRLAWAAAAGTSLVVLIFSYWYLWTAALAWLGGLTVVWLFGRRDFKRSLPAFAIIYGCFFAGMIPYVSMVSRRLTDLDSGLKIDLTRAPDLFRAPEILGLGVLALIWFGVVRRQIDWRAPQTLFALSFGLMPLLVFNQQIITGRSVQPYHYAIFIVNYVVLVGAVMALVLLWRSKQTAGAPVRYRMVARIVFLALWWGAVEVVVHTRVMMRESQLKDPMAAVGQRLRQLSSSDAITDGPNPRPLVLATQDSLAIMIPTFAPQALLWSQNFDFLNVRRQEIRRRFYEYLYYSGIDSAALREDLSSQRSRFRTAIFGHERVIQYLSAVKSKPITEDEIAEQVRQYEAFVNSFKDPQEFPLSYLVYPIIREPSMTNIDKWYERDAGEEVEGFKIHRVRLRRF